MNAAPHAPHAPQAQPAVPGPDAAAPVLLSVRNLTLRFGGLLAVDGLSFDLRRGEVLTLIGPNGAGKTTVFNLISRIYSPQAGSIVWAGAQGGAAPVTLTEQPAHAVAQLGIARTFQNMELFGNASVLHNLLIGHHTRRETGLWADLLFTPRARAAELRARHKAEQVLDFLRLQRHRDLLVAGLPYGVRKLVELARALCAEPQLLLPDEPSSGLRTCSLSGRESRKCPFGRSAALRRLPIARLWAAHRALHPIGEWALARLPSGQ